MLNRNRVIPLSMSIRPGRDFSPTYNCFTGIMSVLRPGVSRQVCTRLLRSEFDSVIGAAVPTSADALLAGLLPVALVSCLSLYHAWSLDLRRSVAAETMQAVDGPR